MKRTNTLDLMIEAGEFSIDINGHTLGGGEKDESLSSEGRKQILDLLRGLGYADGVLVGLAIAERRAADFESTMRCIECGDRLNFSLFGRKLSAHRCAFPDGVPFPFEGVLAVPSGRIAFCDRFDFFEDPPDMPAPAMNMLCALRRFQAAVNAGYPMAQSGNTGARIYRKGNSLHIADYKEAEVPSGYKCVGKIHVSSRPWQVGDFDQVYRDAAHVEGLPTPLVVVNVPAGKYRILVHSLHIEHRGPHFATIEPVA